MLTKTYQDQSYLSLDLNILSIPRSVLYFDSPFETKTKSIAEHLSSVRPSILFETKTKTSLDLKILSKPRPKSGLEKQSLEF